MAIATGQSATARAWLQRTPIERVQAVDPALAATMHLQVAGVHRHAGAFDEAMAELDCADQLMREYEMPFAAALSAFERGNLLANQGDLGNALAAFADSLRIARAAGNPRQQALAHNNLAFHFSLAGNLAAAREHVRAGKELAERHGLSLVSQYLHSTEGEIALAAGELDAADAAFRRALDTARAWNNRVHIANILVNQALVARARGDLAQARTLVAEAGDLIGDAVDPVVRDRIARYRAQL
jgi:tetratricopeptide (TPR) repeat protein